MSAASPQLGDPVPTFSLREVTSDAVVTIDDVAGEHGTVIMFLCRHCPYVKHVQDEVARLARDYAARGVGFVGISANDVTAQPDDAPPRLAEQKRTVGFDFPYLFDESQTVAQAFGAACTPEFFVADATGTLVYRGRLDATRPGGPAPDGADLRATLDALIAGREIDDDQHPAIGCSIKWRPGNEPDAGLPQFGVT